MGIITRLLHRSEGLAKNRYNTFFMDMGENIHIHYRDIRIEFSAEEFIEFADLCVGYLTQVRGEIDAGYRDGVHPNTNQLDTIKTFTNGKPLKNTIAYSPTRISLEENRDGYHIHLRNYKLLLDKDSFMNVARAMRDALEMSERKVDLRETLATIEANELVFRTEEAWQDDRLELARLAVEAPFFKKTIQVLEALGYAKKEPQGQEQVFESSLSRIFLRRIPATPKLSTKVEFTGPVVPLTEYLKRNAESIAPKDVNLLKLQVLDFYEFVRRQESGAAVEIDHDKLYFDTLNGKVIFPATSRSEPSDVDEAWSKFSQFLDQLKLGFVKPARNVYDADELRELEASFAAFLKNELASNPCVKKVYLLNSIQKKASKPKTGTYEVPLVHFSWAKLGSDFDLLIEIDEQYPIPEKWKFRFFWKASGSDYYHLGDTDYKIETPFAGMFPNVDFHHHLVEAYLFFPSRMDKAAKDAFLEKFPSEVIYEKPGANSELPAFLQSAFGLKVEGVDVINEAGFNEVYRVQTEQGLLVAKISKGMEFSPPSEGFRGTHPSYEAELLNALVQAGLPAIAPIKGLDGKFVQAFDKRHLMLFAYVALEPAGVLSLQQVRQIARTLAAVHQVLEARVASTQAYRFDVAMKHWLDDFEALSESFASDPAMSEKLKKLFPAIRDARHKMDAVSDLPWVHCHGDVVPGNFPFSEDKVMILDFQAAHFGPRIGDLAEGALEFAYSPASRAIDPAIVEAFIQAYGEVSPLQEAERSLLGDVMLLHAALKLVHLMRLSVVFKMKTSHTQFEAFLAHALRLIQASA